jgi:hypothetical protein
MDLGHHSLVPYAERHAVDGSGRPLRGWMDGAMVDGWWGYGGLGYTLYSSTIVVLVVANHHHEMKSTGHKFFAQQIFTPHSPFLGSLYFHPTRCHGIKVRSSHDRANSVRSASLLNVTLSQNL